VLLGIAVVIVVDAAPPSVSSNTVPGIHYVGSAICRTCHPAEYRSFRQSKMGRSFFRPDQSATDLVGPGVTIYNQALDRYFRTYTDNGAVYQSEYQLDSQGHDVFRVSHRLTYVVGTGENGYSFLVENSGALCEAPLSWYAKPHKWDFSPGYDHTDFGFSRPVDPACLSCHASRLVNSLASSGYTTADDLAVTCENCHGPGQLHVEDHSKGSGTPNQTGAIINPSRLTQPLSNDICVSCHENGSIRVLKPGRHWSDFRPGLPLDLTFSIFAITQNNDVQQQSPLLGHYSGLIRSRCYRESNGEMRCISCHDPHPRNNTGRSVAGSSGCLTCHTARSCSRGGQGQATGQSCAGCHMAKLPVTTISHAVLTSHTIRRPPFVPDQTETKQSASWLIQVNTPGEHAKADRVTLFKAYYELIREHPELGDAYRDLFRQLSADDRESSVVLSATAMALRQQADSHSTVQARDQLSRAIDQGSTYPTDYVSLAELLDNAGDLQAAVSTLRRGILNNPFFPGLYAALASLYARNRQYEPAAVVVESYLQRFPQDSAIRDGLKRLRSTE
jgi:hypothetical protein